MAVFFQPKVLWVHGEPQNLPLWHKCLKVAHICWNYREIQQLNTVTLFFATLDSEVDLFNSWSHCRSRQEAFWALLWSYWQRAKVSSNCSNFWLSKSTSGKQLDFWSCSTDLPAMLFILTTGREQKAPKGWGTERSKMEAHYSESIMAQYIQNLHHSESSALPFFGCASAR